ncbi:MAG: hypothetical protein WKF40_07035 [Thermoleophilaceae bacterium]
MRAVNLLPEGDRVRGPAAVPAGSSRLVLGVLGALVLAVLVLVLSQNQITNHKAEIVSASQEQKQAEQRAAQLGSFGEFSQIKKTRVTSISTLAESRFDYERLMRELARVLPGDTWVTEVAASSTGSPDGAAPATPAPAPSSGARLPAPPSTTGTHAPSSGPLLLLDRGPRCGPRGPDGQDRGLRQDPVQGGRDDGAPAKPPPRRGRGAHGLDPPAKGVRLGGDRLVGSCREGRHRARGCGKRYAFDANVTFAAAPGRRPAGPRSACRPCWEADREPQRPRQEDRDVAGSHRSSVAGFWFLLLSPKRAESARLGEQLTTVEQKRDAAVAKAGQLEGARNTYAEDYATVVRLGKAVPTSLDMPSLLVQLESAAKGTGIDFDGVKAGARTTDPAAAPAAGGASGAQTGPGKTAENANNAKAGADKSSGRRRCDERRRAVRLDSTGLGPLSSDRARPGQRSDRLHLHRQLHRAGRLPSPDEAVRARGQRQDQRQGKAHDNRQPGLQVHHLPDHRSVDHGHRLPLAQERGRHGGCHRGRSADHSHVIGARAESRSVGDSGLHAAGRRGRAVKPLALGVFEDLRRRRLLPVAILLLVALVAVPVLMLKKADPVPVGTSVPAVAAGTADGLPSPKEALAGDKPLVSLAVLKQSSDLDSFASKNPFKPMEQVSTGGAGSTPAVAPAPVAPAPGGEAPPVARLAVAWAASLPAALRAHPDGGSDRGGGGGGGGTPTKPAPPVDPPPANEPDKPQRKLTYAVDLTFTSPRGRRACATWPSSACCRVRRRRCWSSWESAPQTTKRSS